MYGRAVRGGKSLEKFEYNNDHSYATNFFNWRYMNNKEKQIYGQDHYTINEAKKIFDGMYKNKDEQKKDE